jgi:mannose-1-phosphate guanylyltransferase/phosphomannomutase
MIAVILSGGKGTRLHPLTLNTPKPMLPINGIPHLEYQIKLLKEHGFRDIIFSTGYLHSQIKDYFGKGRNHGVIIRYKEDGGEPLGTAGALRNCLDLIDEEEVLVLNGDILTNINLTAMKEKFQSDLRSPMMIALTPVEDPTQFGVADMVGGKIKRFIEKPSDGSYGNLINAGIYMMYKGIVNNFIEDGFSMIENTIFPQFAKAGMLGAYIDDYYWLDIGTHDRYEQAQKDAKIFFA